MAEETLDFVPREMTGPDGGFYSTLDADTEGHEGRFYVWTAEEIDAALPPEDAALIKAWFAVTPGGNFEGTTVLSTPRSLETVATEAGSDTRGRSQPRSSAVCQSCSPLASSARDPGGTRR